MHEPQRLLARLNTISVDWQNSARMTGDILRAEDIAACMSGLESGPYLLLRYLWCQDGTVENELRAIIQQEVYVLANHNSWGCKNNINRLNALSKMALYEFQKVNLCKPCKGTGVKLNQVCARCNGSGKKKMTQAERAKVCGIKPSNWVRSWEQKYEEIYLLLVDWNEKGISHILSRL